MNRKRHKKRTRIIASKAPVSDGNKKPLTLTERMTADVRERAERFREWYESRFEEKLPYSMDSVRKLDFLLYRNRRGETLSEESVFLMQSFFSEILRRNLGGKYELDSKKKQVLVNFGGLKAWSDEKILRAIKNLERDGIPKNAYSLKTHGPLESYLFNIARKVSAIRNRENDENEQKQ